MTVVGACPACGCPIYQPDGWWFSMVPPLPRPTCNCAATMGRVRAAMGLKGSYSGNTGVSTGPHLHWQLSDTPSFPIDIAHSRDPLQNMAGPDDEGEPMTKNERTLTAVAWGDYERMKASYNALVNAGLIPDEGIGAVDDLNSAVVKRGRIMELVATNPDKAIEVIK